MFNNCGWRTGVHEYACIHNPVLKQDAKISHPANNA